MNTPTGSLRERKKRKTHDSLIEVAYRLFQQKGFERTTVDEIVAEVEISQRTFFRYFPTKEAVIFSKHADRIGRFRSFLDKHSHEAPGKAVRKALLDMAREYETDSRDLLREYRIVTASPVLIARDLELDAEFEEAIARALQRDETGDRAGFHARVLAGAIFGAVRSTMATWFAGGCQESLANLGGQTFDILASGIASS